MKTTRLISVIIKTIKYIGLTIVFVLALMIATPYVFSDKIKEETKKTANRKLAAKLDYSNAEVSFFKHFPSLTLTLTEFNLNGSAPFQNEKFITAKEVSFGINLYSIIFSKSISIDEIYLSDSYINVKVNKNGLANYNVYKSESKQQKKEDETTGIRLENIEIKNINLIYDDQSTNFHIDIYGLNYIGKGNLDKEIFDLYSKANIKKLNVLYENEPYMMNKKVDADLITKINTNSLSFVFEQNDLMINKLPVDFKGKFDFLKEGYFMDFIIKSDNSNIEDIFTAFPPKYITWLNKTDLKGKTDLLFKLKGNYIESRSMAPDLNLDLKVRNGYVNYNKSAFPISKLNLDINTSLPSLNPERAILDIKNIALNINQDYLKAKIRVEGIKIPEIDATFNSKIDLEKLNKALGIADFEIKGFLEGKGNVKGKYDQKNGIIPITDANINLKSGYIKTQYYPNPITNINIVTNIENTKGTISGLKVILNPAQFTFEGNPVYLKANLDNFTDLNYNIKAKGTLDIGKIYKVFTQKGLDIHGTIKANLVLKGKQSDAEKGKYNKLYNNGSLELKNIAFKTENLPEIFLIKKGVFSFKQDKMYFQNFTATYGQSDFAMNGYLQNVFNFISSKNSILKGKFTLNSNFINADEFMSKTVIKDSKPTIDTNIEEQLRPTNIATGVIMIPENFDVEFQAFANKINFNKLNLNNAQGELKMHSGTLTMQNTGFDLIGCKVTMNAKYFGINPKKANFEYEIKATEFDIKRAYKEIEMFKTMVSAAESAEGIISLDYKLKGRLNSNMEPVYPSINGNGVITVNNIKIKGMKMFDAVGRKTSNDGIKNPELSKVEIKSSIKNNIITLERFKFKFAGFRPRIEGTTSLDGKLNIKMRLGLPPMGIIGIPLIIKGNKDNPKVKIGRKSEDLKETQDIE